MNKEKLDELICSRFVEKFGFTHIISMNESYYKELKEQFKLEILKNRELI